jgi:hypothetical protein
VTVEGEGATPRQAFGPEQVYFEVQRKPKLRLDTNEFF